MRAPLLVCVSTLALLCGSVSAQNVGYGFITNVGAGATSRGAIGANPGQLLFRFDNEDYRGWGDAQATSATTTDITGMTFILQDQFGTSQEQYDIRFYGEDLTTPNLNFPNFLPSQPVGTNQLAHFGPFQSPANTTAAPIAWFITVTFATPLSLPNNQDVFAGVELQASASANTAATPPNWPNDGLSVQISLGFVPGAAFTVYDFKGAGAIAGGATANSYGLVHDPVNGTFAYGGPRQGMVDLLVPSTIGRGVVAAVTNQTSYTLSNAPPGTASFFSGLHPDAAAPPANAGRADDSSYVFLGAPSGSLVFFLVDFNFGAFPLKLSTLVPGSSGEACLNLGVFQTLGFSLASGTGTDAFTISWSAGARTLLAGNSIVMQGVSFDPVAGVLHSGACGAQRF